MKSNPQSNQIAEMFSIFKLAHRRVVGADAQAAQHVALVADRPDGDLLHPALGQAGHQRDVTQGDGRDLQPGASHGDLATPAGRAKHRQSFPSPQSLSSSVDLKSKAPGPSPAPDKVFHGFVTVECPAEEE